MNSPVTIFRFLFSHPLAGKNKVSACWRFLKWQLGTRVFPFPVQWPFVEGTSLLVKRGMTGATGNIYAGLHEFTDMAFLLHLLRQGDLFGDIGANVGSYSILASGVNGSNTISVEPVLSTFLHLKNNVAVNNLETSVELHHCGVGAEPGKLYFTSSYDTVNHVIAGGQKPAAGSEEVEIKTLDQLFSHQTPALLKIDVEGFEMSVLQGADRLLREPGLKAIILELNGSCNRYGIKEEDVHQLLLRHGFAPVSYSPFERKINPVASFDPHGNTIYIRDEDWIKHRLTDARKIKVLGRDI